MMKPAILVAGLAVSLGACGFLTAINDATPVVVGSKFKSDSGNGPLSNSDNWNWNRSANGNSK